MSVWLRALFVAVLLGSVAGCGTTSDETASAAAKPLKAAHARFKIYRTSDFVAAVPSVRVRIDGREVGQLGVGGSIMVDVPAGSRQIVVDAVVHVNAFTLAVPAKAGVLYTLEVAPRTEPIVAGAIFGLVGTLVEAAANPNGGTFHVRVVDSKLARG